MKTRGGCGGKSSSSPSKKKMVQVVATSKLKKSNSLSSSSPASSAAAAKKAMVHSSGSSRSRRKIKKLTPKKKTIRNNKDPATAAAAKDHTTDTAIISSSKKPSVKETTKDEVTASIVFPWYSIFTKGDKEYNDYMANEWGFEKRGDDALFEALSLEGMQAGLSWLTILRKRTAYRSVFHNFNIEKVAAMDCDDVLRIMEEQSENKSNLVVKHQGKLLSIIRNARAIQQIRSWSGDTNNSFDAIVWNFVQDKPILNLSTAAPSVSEESIQMGKQLKKLNFSYVGPKICYSFMQSIGMVIDHPVDSPEWNAAHQRLQSRPNGYQTR